MGSGIDKRQLELTVYDVLLESASVAEARVKADMDAVERALGELIFGYRAKIIEQAADERAFAKTRRGRDKG